MNELLAALKAIQEEPRFRNDGICGNLSAEMVTRFDRQLSATESAALTTLFRSWPETSREIGYPVPCPFNSWYGSARAHYLTTTTMWCGAYGESRKRLLAYMITELESPSLYR